MSLSFSLRPGAHERQLLVRYNNPLFPAPRRQLNKEELAEAQRTDQEELEKFRQDYLHHVRHIAELDSHVESDVILKLKGESDELYERACGVAGDLDEIKLGLQKIIASMMNAVISGAGGDSYALSELQQEETARQAHFSLLQIPMVADMLRPDTPIRHDELLPTLLSLPCEQFAMATSLFDDTQRGQLAEDARQLLAGQTDTGSRIVSTALENLATLLSTSQS